VSKLTKEGVELSKDAGYSERVIELYRNKVNVGSIDKPDVNLAYTDPCGDTMKICLKINCDGVVDGAEIQSLGCLGAASSGPVMTRIVRASIEITSKKLRSALIRMS